MVRLDQANHDIPAETRHWPIVGSVLVQRCRRCTNTDPALGHCPVFAAMYHQSAVYIIKHVDHSDTLLLRVSGLIYKLLLLDISNNILPHLIL